MKKKLCSLIFAGIIVASATMPIQAAEISTINGVAGGGRFSREFCG